jgi:mycothiol synthase
MLADQQQTTHPALQVRIRPLADADYPRLVEIMTLCHPDEVWTVEEVTHWERAWDRARFVREHVVAEDARGGIVGFGRYHHVSDEYEPDVYRIDVEVDPAARQRGVGRVLYAHLMAALRGRGAIAARASVEHETDAAAIAFLRRRGFVEVFRGWQSRLDVSAFNFARFAGAAPRVAQQGVRLTTLAAGLARDPEVLTKVYDLMLACEHDVPSAAAVTDTPYEMFLAHTVEGPNALPDAHFLAVAGDRYVGTSALMRAAAMPGVLFQGLTGVRREYRGCGIAMALKLQTVRYAREHGHTEIRTWNASLNRPMLRINEAMGFVRQPATLGFRKGLTATG